jgi:hypothetical protein
MVQKDRVDEIFRAKQQVVAGSLTIWNERLTALVNAGDLTGALDQMVSPAELIADVTNNCGCNVQCGSLARGEQLATVGQGPRQR